jgi:hypothetical protein
VRHHRLFAAGLAAALMLGAAAPALAGPGKGKANAPGQTKTKPKPEKTKPPAKKAKKTKSGVSGGGVVNGAEFSIQARLRDVRNGSASKGHFNYTDATTKIRCRGFNEFTPNLADGTATVVFKNCTVTGQPTVTTIEVKVDDNGQPNYVATPPVADTISFVAGTLTVPVTALTDGNVKVR